MTKTRKSPSLGWVAETDVQLEGTRYLNVMTLKSSRGQIVTRAQAILKENGMTSFIIFQDYNKTLARCEGKKATEKNIAQCHESVLKTSVFEDTVKEAKQFYQIKSTQL